MSPRLTFRRFLQIAHGYSKNQIAENAETLSIDPLQHIEISSNLNDLEGITRYIKEKDFKVLVVDVIDGLKTTSRADDKMEALAPELKRIANDLDIIVIGIHHISKYASRESKLDIHSGKGSSGAEQKADKIFGIEGNREGTLRKIKVLGARDESTFEIFAESDPVNFRFYQLIGETK
jgi:predicted ATP-dependent serine protease